VEEVAVEVADSIDGRWPALIMGAAGELPGGPPHRTL
jgi:hypothetical protein